MSSFRSIRFKLSVQYSAMVFGLGGALLGLVYLAFRYWLENQSMNRYVIGGDPVWVEGVLVGSIPNLSDHDLEMIETAYNQVVLNEVARYTGLAVVALFLLSMIVGWFMSGRVLKPIDQITRITREIEASDLSRRLNLPGPDDELTRLGGTIDGMLERLDRAFRGQRRFLADTSHDLRNPLAVIRSNIEVALEDSDIGVVEWREIGEIVRRNVEKMGEMIDGLLAVARAETDSRSPMPVQLHEIVRRKVRDHQPVTFEAGVRIVDKSAPVEVDGVELALERALSNLVDNAIRFAPVSSSLTIASGSYDGWAYLAVDDEGPGIELEDGSVPIGLGLSIVERVADSHGGGLSSFSGKSGNGTTMVLWLPFSSSQNPHPNNSPLTNT
jgi:signal transduction histidine kinase